MRCCRVDDNNGRFVDESSWLVKFGLIRSSSWSPFSCAANKWCAFDRVGASSISVDDLISLPPNRLDIESYWFVFKNDCKRDKKDFFLVLAFCKYVLNGWHLEYVLWMFAVFYWAVALTIHLIDNYHQCAVVLAMVVTARNLRRLPNRFHRAVFGGYFHLLSVTAILIFLILNLVVFSIHQISFYLWMTKNKSKTNNVNQAIRFAWAKESVQRLKIRLDCWKVAINMHFQRHWGMW